MECTSDLLVKLLAAIKRLQVRAPLGADIFRSHEYTQLHFQIEQVFITTSFIGDEKPSVPGSYY